MDTVLRMTNITKRFGHIAALDGVDFNLKRGEIHALLGINGAGKSTLIKILSGIYSKDGGEIEIAGKKVELGSPRASIAEKIATVQQHPELVGDFTGYENIFLGQECSKPGLFRKIDKAKLRLRAREILGNVPVEIDLSMPVSQMPAVDREIVAILHALRQEDIRILILDEPTSTLTEREKESLFRLMRDLKQSGIAIIYITHRLEEVFEIADRFTIFRAGRSIAHFTNQEAREKGVSIPLLMLDRPPDTLFPPKNDRAQNKNSKNNDDHDNVMEVKELGREGQFENINFVLRKGSICGIYGLVGSGVDALSKTLFGALKPDHGEICFRGKKITLKNPAHALDQGIFLVPGDRRQEGLVMGQDVIFNTVLANLDRASRLKLILRFGQNHQTTADLARNVDLQPLDLKRSSRFFSGGNQQKIVIAKGLYRQAEVYIFVEPTVGVDIGARAKIYLLMRALSKQAAVLIISSDCDEVYGVADETLALYKGRPVGKMSQTLSRNQLLAAGVMGKLPQESQGCEGDMSGEGSYEY